MRIFRNAFTYILGTLLILLGVALRNGYDPIYPCLFIIGGLFVMGLFPAMLYSPKKSDTVFDGGNNSYAIVFGCVIIAITMCAICYVYQFVI